MYSIQCMYVQMERLRCGMMACVKDAADGVFAQSKTGQTVSGQQTFTVCIVYSMLYL